MINTDGTQDYDLTEEVLGRRAVAWLLDTLILSVILAILFVVVLLFGLITLGLGLPLLGLLWVVPTLYSFAFIISDTQATLGQMLCGLRVVRNDDLGRPTPLQAGLYALGFWLTVAAGMIWLAVALFTRRNRCLHDMLSGLVVIRAEALTVTQIVNNMGSTWYPR
jgi:uncharacterized RDD family membrane protein YckC